MNSTSIPALLITHRGNQHAVTRQLGISRNTVRKYAEDSEMKRHIIIDGVLFVIACRKRAPK
ncbi:protein ninH [Klebsiella pneumoniae]|uniref:protein ninH n=1 Tax=Klebsiella pneumoniae TaxID=573 RepID=UPI0022441404|nr:protein ninH [Klebsiella pneumoniae]MDA4006375.1 protein ninH [Klebsiella pneumoniae]